MLYLYCGCTAPCLLTGIQVATARGDGSVTPVEPSGLWPLTPLYLNVRKLSVVAVHPGTGDSAHVCRWVT